MRWVRGCSVHWPAARKFVVPYTTIPHYSFDCTLVGSSPHRATPKIAAPFILSSCGLQSEQSSLFNALPLEMIVDLAIDISVPVSDTFRPHNPLSHRTNTLKEVPLSPIPASLANFVSFSRTGTIGMLSDEVLLNIFRYYLDASPRLWPRLTHICRKWRHIAFASKRALHLRLLCSHGTPVLKTLDCWPTLPIVVQYGAPPVPGLAATEDEDNIMVALMQSDRVSSISLVVTNSLLEKLSAIERPFSELEELVLLSQDKVILTLPGTFQWGLRLRTLHLTRTAIPALPELISLSRSLVDLQIHEIPEPGYFPLDEFVATLSRMTQLRSLSLSHHFLSCPPRNYVRFPPQPGERVVLPALTCLKYRGNGKHLDRFVARIDAPRLGDIDIGYFSQPTIDASQLSQFINRIEMQKLHRQVAILSSEHAISISFTQPGAPSHFKLQISRQPLALQLSYMARICNDLYPFLPGVEHLHIGVRPRATSGQDDGCRVEWLRLIRPFRGTKWVHVTGEYSISIVLALQDSEMRHETVLPALCKLCIQEPEPRYASLRDAVVSFTNSRRLSGHIIAVEYEQMWVNELRGTGTAFAQCPLLSHTNVLGAGPFSSAGYDQKAL
jgi:hypothetical protein